MNKTYLYLVSKLAPLRSARRSARLHLRNFKQQECYSQEGEDLVLSRFFAGKKDGFYIDVGAHHPFRFSNTALFHQRGWKGVNIDPTPGTAILFDRYRPLDVNIECGISTASESLEFFTFNEPALNTFDSEIAAEHAAGGKWKQLDKKMVPNRTLKEVLDTHLPKGQKIDFLTIDVEGFDYEVLSSNDWSKYLPEVIVIEVLGHSVMAEFLSMPEVKLLSEHGYQCIAKTLNTAFFQRILPHE